MSTAQSGIPPVQSCAPQGDSPSRGTPTGDRSGADRSAESAIGIDAGATLCKVAWRGGERLELIQFPARQIALIEEFAARRNPKRIIATGGGASEFGAQVAGIEIETDLEFAAWARGAPALAARQGVTLPDRYLLVSVGTGTSILLLEGLRFTRLGGTALGGGALLGLGQLLLGTRAFGEIAELASRGDRSRVDLLVGDIYREPPAPLPARLNAASFAKLASREPPDLAHALVGLIGENIGLLCSEFGRTHEVSCVVYGGSTVGDNPALQAVLRERGEASGQRLVFLRDGAFCGAVGAAIKHDPPSDPSDPGRPRTSLG
jgi:type II pantothenate kinase